MRSPFNKSGKLSLPSMANRSLSKLTDEITQPPAAPSVLISLPPRHFRIASLDPSKAITF